MSYRIEDWTGRVMFDGRTFDSFDAGWAHIYETDPAPAGAENHYDDYYVVVVPIAIDVQVRQLLRVVGAAMLTDDPYNDPARLAAFAAAGLGADVTESAIDWYEGGVELLTECLAAALAKIATG